MNSKIVFLEIENFKTFRGVFRIELLEDVNSVVGRNGTGKTIYDFSNC